MVAAKSDFEKTIQHFCTGGLLRLNAYVLNVEFWGTRGGGYTGRSENTELRAAEEMWCKYPDFISGISSA